MSSAAVAGTAAADGDVVNNDSKYPVPWVALYDSFQQKNVYVAFNVCITCARK